MNDLTYGLFLQPRPFPVEIMSRNDNRPVILGMNGSKCREVYLMRLDSGRKPREMRSGSLISKMHECGAGQCDSNDDLKLLDHLIVAETDFGQSIVNGFQPESDQPGGA